MSRTVLTPVSAILVVNRQADGHLERSGVGHAALFALGDVVFQLQAHRIAAAVAEGDDILVERSAAVAQHVADMERIGFDGGAAARIAAGGTQVMQPLQVAALALPVSDRVIDELQLAQPAEIGDRKHGIEHALQAGIFPLAGKQVHLQKPLIRFLLNFDQIGDRDRSLDSGEIHSLARNDVCQIFHFYSYGRWSRDSFANARTNNRCRLPTSVQGRPGPDREPKAVGEDRKQRDTRQLAIGRP